MILLTQKTKLMERNETGTVVVVTAGVKEKTKRKLDETSVVTTGGGGGGGADTKKTKKPPRRFTVKRVDTSDLPVEVVVWIPLLEGGGGELLLLRLQPDVTISEELASTVRTDAASFTVTMWGKTTTAARRTVNYGKEYQYKGSTGTSGAFPTELCGLASNLSERFGLEPVFPLNSAIATVYADGADKIGLHSDASRTMLPGSPVVCISKGATRTLTFERDETAERWLVDIPENVAYCMYGRDFQAKLTHGIDPLGKNAAPVGERISITLRTML